jgi:transcriptional regulator with XRE-family HTH domain
VPLTAEEAQIGRRIRLAREEHGASQALTARRIFLSRDQLKRIESGEVPVRPLPALRFCEFTNRNPLWLAFGEPENRFGFFWVLPTQTTDQGLQEFKVGANPDWEFDPVFAGDLTFLQMIDKCKDRFSSGTRFFATSDTEPRWRLGESEKPIGAVFQGRSPNVTYQLTTRRRFGNVQSMNLQKSDLWPRLRERIRKLVRRRGAKAALAHDIGISRQAVNGLLRKKYVPSAEFTLRLAKWVELVEAKQKNADRDPRRPTPKTQVRKSRNEKPNSDQQKS